MRLIITMKMMIIIAVSKNQIKSYKSEALKTRKQSWMSLGILNRKMRMIKRLMLSSMKRKNLSLKYQKAKKILGIPIWINLQYTITKTMKRKHHKTSKKKQPQILSETKLWCKARSHKLNKGWIHLKARKVLKRFKLEAVDGWITMSVSMMILTITLVKSLLKTC